MGLAGASGGICGQTRHFLPPQVSGSTILPGGAQVPPSLSSGSSLLTPAALHCAVLLLQHCCLTFLVTSALGQALASVTKALVCPLCSSQAHRRSFNFLSTHEVEPPSLSQLLFSPLVSPPPPPTLHTELFYTTPKTARTLSPPSLCLGPFRLEHLSTCPTMPPADLYRIPFIFQDSVPRPDSEALPTKALTVPRTLKGTSLAVSS